MKRIFAVTAALVALSAPHTPLHAQTTPAVIGSWEIEYARGQRVTNEGTENIMAKARMIIAQSGDSLIATLEQPPRPDGTPAMTVTIGGRASNGDAVFVQKTRATLNINGEQQQAEITVTWTLQAAGDALTGTVLRELPMMGTPTPSPIKGTRLKS